MPKLLRPILVALHLLSMAAWLGGASVVILAALRERPQVMFVAHDDLVVWASAASALTGAWLCVFLPWGFTRFWWVIAKWTVTLALAAVQIIAIAPAVATLTAGESLGDTLALGVVTRVLVLQGGVFAALTLLVLLSLIKPWGRARMSDKPGRRVQVSVIVASGIAIAMTLWQVSTLNALRELRVGQIDAPLVGEHTCAADTPLGGGIAVVVYTRAGRVADMAVTQHPPFHYAELGARVVERVQAAGHINVDGVSGATTTSRVVLKAAESALERCDGPGVEAHRP